ncbi:MAG: fimbrial biogenesis usher protein [Scandinavium sp.]|uniref:fimbrial biogenesis usher protein n=1 Tax=Scandinavium sp. TaxID=2830653 RepID=UPI003F345917
MLVSLFPLEGLAENYFNPAFLSADPDAVADLSHFESDSQAPGVYRVDIYLNEKFLDSRDILFKAREKNADTTENAKATTGDGTGLYPCLKIKSLEAAGVNVSAIESFKGKQHDECVNIEEYIPAAQSSLNFEQLRLDLSIPQAALANQIRGYIPPERWDNGINALLLNYQFTGSNSHKRTEEGKGTDTSYFLNLNSGLNLGPWRLRDTSTFSYNKENGRSEKDWEHISTYVERAIIPFRSTLVVGDTYTNSDIFDGMTIRGAKLETDENMLPDSQRGFAPTVRGIAKTNAQVTIKQNGYTIYQSYVPPGAFEINDLYATSSSGDLVVEVKENDGSTNSYTVPYSSVPLLQREGHVKYSVVGGRYRSSSDQQDDVDLAQFTLIWGLPHGITTYGGAQMTKNYRSLALGLGFNLGSYGAVSADITQAHSTLMDDTEHRGQSLRFLYAKSLNEVGTNIQLLGYRYSTKGYYSLAETTYRHMSGYTVDTQDGPEEYEPSWTDYYNLYYNKRGKIEANLSQQLHEYGSLYLTASRQSYWNTDETNTLVQMGYSGSIGSVNYNLSYNYNKSPGSEDKDQIFALNFSLPLSQWLSPGGGTTMSQHNMYATMNTSTDAHGNMSQSAGLGGTLLDDNNLDYSIQQGYSNHGGALNGSANMSYKGTYNQANVGYSYSDHGDYQQVNYGLSGGIVAHRHGVTFSQPLGDTNVLIAAPGASDVHIDGNNGLRTDWRGYAIVPYATNYRMNRMSIDTNTLKNNVDIEDSVATVVPTKGALVLAEFKAHVGIRALISLMRNGRPVPFGATVSRDDEGSSSLVGDDGQVYLTALAPKGKLMAQWGEGSESQCEFDYVLPADAEEQLMTKLTGECK